MIHDVVVSGITMFGCGAFTLTLCSYMDSVFDHNETGQTCGKAMFVAGFIIATVAMLL